MQVPYSGLIIGLLTATIALTACQKKQEPVEPAINDKVAEEAVPMSAEPADPSDIVIEPSAEEVGEITVAQVEEVEPPQVSYTCTPELALAVSYDDTAKHVTLNTSNGSIVLEQTGEGAYETATTLTGEAGLSQWQVTNASDTGILKISIGSGDNKEVTTYECKVAE